MSERGSDLVADGEDVAEESVADGSIAFRASSNVEVSGSVVSGNVTVGDQTLKFVEADVQIRVATAAHQRELERQRLERELEKEKRQEEEDYKDRYHQRIRDNCTFVVVVVLIIAGLVGSFLVAVTSSDPTQQVWAQGLTMTIAGVVGGAFAGYLIGGKK